MQGRVIDIGLDTETTGLCSVEKGTELPGRHDIIQIAGIVLGLETEREITFEGKCQPIRWDSIAQQALDVHGYQVADLKKFPESGTLCVQFRLWLDSLKTNPADRFRMIAHNMPFDYKFIRSWFLKNQFCDFDRFFVPQDECICTKKLGNAAKKAGDLPGIENMKLITAAKYIGYRFDAHDALGDTMACLKWFEYLKTLPHYKGETGGPSAAMLRSEGKEPQGTDEEREVKATGTISL